MSVWRSLDRAGRWLLVASAALFLAGVVCLLLGLVAGAIIAVAGGTYNGVSVYLTEKTYGQYR